MPSWQALDVVSNRTLHTRDTTTSKPVLATPLTQHTARVTSVQLLHVDIRIGAVQSVASIKP